MSVTAQAKSRRKAYAVQRNHGDNYTQRRHLLGASSLGSAASTLFAKVSKTATKSGAKR